MIHRKRARVLLRIAIFVLIVSLGILFLAASFMSRRYGTPDRDDDAQLKTLLHVLSS